MQRLETVQASGYPFEERAHPISLAGWSQSSVALLVVAHAVLGVILQRVPALGLAQLCGALVYMAYALTRPSPVPAFAAAVYLGSSEVLWRITKIPVPWESAKYLIAIVPLISIVLHNRRLRPVMTPALYIMFMVPSALIVLADSSQTLEQSRQSVMAGLLAPLAIASTIAAARFLDLDQRAFRLVAGAAVMPLVTIAAIAAAGTYGRSDIVFNTESNTETSGGFGPSQVSTVLSFGTLLALLAALDTKSRVPTRLAFLLAAIGLLVQCVMTFSRGGLYNIAGAVLVALPALLQRRHARRMVVVGLGVAIAFSAALLVQANEFTGGALEKRFSETQTTGRTTLMADDLRIFFENPLLGVGPGSIRIHRANLGGALDGASAHTEVTRMLGEHGLLGLGSLLVMAFLIAYRLLVARKGRERAIVVALITWALLAQFNSALRTAAPILALSLAFARYRLDDEIDDEESASRSLSAG